VIIDFTSPREEWARLGHGYQVDLRIVLWEGDDIIKLPLTALFRNGDEWAVFVDADGRAAIRAVTVGRRNGLEAEITEGLQAGERVVMHPSDKVIDGVRIAGRD
jgi:HlyD family secretion protein